MDGVSDRWQDDSLFGVDFDKRKENGYQGIFACDLNTKNDKNLCAHTC